mmetsp:Transcript_10994/g.28147  ORF Transcript_10994/g.28147 Transcript_10994/m.28147 type:complete len:237 (+) Transcript_10994:243-953(+)
MRPATAELAMERAQVATDRPPPATARWPVATARVQAVAPAPTAPPPPLPATPRLRAMAPHRTITSRRLLPTALLRATLPPTTPSIPITTTRRLALTSSLQPSPLPPPCRAIGGFGQRHMVETRRARRPRHAPPSLAITSVLPHHHSCPPLPPPLSSRLSRRGSSPFLRRPRRSRWRPSPSIDTTTPAYGPRRHASPQLPSSQASERSRAQLPAQPHGPLPLWPATQSRGSARARCC